jgi:hypothetical protein
MGPQSEPSGVVNVGVAAHITAASQGGPRFDVNISEKERRSASNGIWLCQNCAKLIDSDLEAYSAESLREWKGRAEAEARKRIGKTHSRAGVRSHKKAVAAIKHDQKMRDDLTRDLLKKSSERMGLPRGYRAVRLSFCTARSSFAGLMMRATRMLMTVPESAVGST